MATQATVAQRLAEAAQRLACVTETPRLDAEILLAHALGISRSRLLAHLSDLAESPGFRAMLERRFCHEPIAYILGEWEFFSLTFKVAAPLLVPRPETEHLVEAVLDFIGDRPARVLDVGTGTGCVALSIAHNAPRAEVVATDIVPFALEVAQENCARFQLGERVAFRQGDLFQALECADPPFDVICSNPPYVEAGAWSDLPPVIRMHEDPRALLAGKDGLDVIRRLAAEARAFLKPKGLLAFEIGMGQRDPVKDILIDCRYRNVTFRPDLAGIERIALAEI